MSLGSNSGPSSPATIATRFSSVHAEGIPRTLYTGIDAVTEGLEVTDAMIEGLAGADNKLTQSFCSKFSKSCLGGGPPFEVYPSNSTGSSLLHGKVLIHHPEAVRALTWNTALQGPSISTTD